MAWSTAPNEIVTRVWIVPPWDSSYGGQFRGIFCCLAKQAILYRNYVRSASFEVQIYSVNLCFIAAIDCSDLAAFIE